MQTLLTKDFWKFAFERAITTVAEAATATLGINGAVVGFDILKVDWIHLLSISVGAGLVSILLSVSAYGKK